MENSESGFKLNLSPELQEYIEKLIRERTEALKTEITERKRAEKKLIETLNRLERKRVAILNLMEDLKEENEERKRTEKKFEAERNLLLTLIDNIPDPINLKNSEGRYIIDNRRHHEQIGAKDREDTVGKTAMDFFTPDDASVFEKTEKNVLKTGKPVYDMEEYLFHKGTNEMRWYLTSKIPVPDEEGNLTRVLTISHDITERKILETRLKESENYYRTLIDISPEAITIINTEGFLTYASKNAYRLFEVPDDFNIEETTVLDWVDSSYHDKIATVIAQFMTGERKHYADEYLLKKYTGEPYWAEISSAPLTDANGNIIAFVIISRDITERKKYQQELIRAKEKAEESDRLKTAFLNNISHEIRTPINVISGMTMLLKQPGNDPENMKTYLDTIVESCNQLIDIVNDIILLSNIDAGTDTLEFGNININTLITELYEKFLPETTEKGIEFHYETPLSHEKAMLRTDGIKLRKALTNLLSNAVKFTHTGSINFGYRINDGKLEFFVSDTGIGIDKTHHEKIFERFYQIEHSLSRKYEGLGIGLTIAKAYTEMINGKISVVSEPGKGSDFTISLPYHDTSEFNIQKELKKYSRPVIKSTVKNVLVVEDDKDSRKFIEIILKKQNINVTMAQNGEEAVALVEKGINFDVILMDLRMPVMDGYEATQIMKKIRPDIPIIAQTAFSQPEDEQKALNAGCSAFISKPFRSADLIEIINKVAGK